MVFVLFDSLNREAMGCYGGTAVPTPNFDRLANRAITFDNHYVGSLPCMPARRDLHTGRLNFMHRSWGPLEPFDDSMPEILKKSGVYTHLVTDHFHYFEDGGATYHNRYSSWDMVRGQEYDPWKAMVEPPVDKFAREYSSRHYNGPEQANRRQHQVNREFVRSEADFPGPQCFDRAFEFLDTNRGADDWMLQIECFDPHEPFHAPERFKQQFGSGYDGPILDWPKYAPVAETDAEIAEIRANYAALVAMCDEYFGKLLDYFDEHALWDDTALIVTTDHGFLLSEHDWWGKNVTPYYDEISHVPLIVHDPRMPQRAGTRCSALTQTPDLMPSILDYFGKPVPADVRSRSIFAAIEDPQPGRCVMFGMFGGPIGITDGRHTYFHYPPDLDDPQLREHTLMPTHLKGFFDAEEFRGAKLLSALPFSKGMPVLSLPALTTARRPPGAYRALFSSFASALYDNDADPGQLDPIDDDAVMERLRTNMCVQLAEYGATDDFMAWAGLAQ
ncbi:choline-sulfatase [Pelagibacterium halotolerans B2]|uniref:Choline-sulfatase n=1 Tax=Pelagibacterium halotolerans (strain DSM 22347 / JCM 15775 / CGMCC 1.7692 / B2) TaxID=1082931 RepID=G4R7A7_PELHB|nr:choline-sulfatase [Pelagibacterium halotolerans B2]